MKIEIPICHTKSIYCDFDLPPFSKTTGELGALPNYPDFPAFGIHRMLSNVGNKNNLKAPWTATCLKTGKGMASGHKTKKALIQWIEAFLQRRGEKGLDAVANLVHCNPAAPPLTDLVDYYDLPCFKTL